MRFQSTWKPVAESGEKSVKLDVEEGTHSPYLAGEGDETRSTVTLNVEQVA